MSILASGEILPSESNISQRAARRGPDVVWLTSLDDPDHVVGGLSDIKLTARIAVEVPSAQTWLDFATRHGAKADWLDILHETGGNQQDTWYVVPRPILRPEWREVIMFHDGEWHEIDFAAG